MKKKAPYIKENKDPNRLIGPDGEFVSSFPGGPGSDVISIGYLEELCEWVFYHNDMPEDLKLSRILALENEIQHLLNGTEDGKPMMGIPCRYIPTWSTKLIEKNETSH